MKKILIVSRGSLSTDKYTPSRSVFCRLYQPFTYMKENNLLSTEVDYLRADQIDETNIKDYRAVIFCKHNTPDSINVARLAIKNNIKTVYDIDDLIHKFTEDSAAYVFMKNVEYVKEHLEMADMVVSENVYLQKILNKDFSIKANAVIQTCINTDKYYKREYQPQKSNVLFTNGDNIKLVHFRNKFVEIFNAFLKKYPKIEFQVFGDSEKYIQDFLRYDFLGALPWDEHKKWLASNQVEFAIWPLGSSEEEEENQFFTNCKTPIKFIEYGAMLIPTIYSDTPVYRNVVENNVTGLLVENTEEAWKAALEEMHHNLELRRKIARAAYDVVRARHHISNSANKWLEIVA